MRIFKEGLNLNNPAIKVLDWLASYEGITDAAGSAAGTTIVDTGLASEPSYDGHVVKLLSGAAAGQERTIAVHAAASNTLLIDAADPFTDSAGAAVQVVAGTAFIIKGAGGGGGSPPSAPEEGLFYSGQVTAVPGANQFTIPSLAGLGAGKFAGGTNPYQAFVIRDAGGASAAPQGELQAITAYVTATGIFTTPAFTAAVAVGDEILIVHPSLAAALVAPVVIASGTFTTSSATVPADNTRTEGANFFRGMLLIPTAGTYINRATRIVEFTTATGVFTVDPNNPFPAATGLVTYNVVRDQSDFVPAGGGTNNRTPSDVIGMKDEVVPVMTLAAATVMTEPIVALVKAILERVGATPADPDDSVLTNIGQRDDAASLDDLSDVTTTSIQAKLRRSLLRMSGAGVFSATIQGAARTELDTMLEQLATYFVAAGAALSVTIDNGGAARTTLATLWNDLGQMLAGGAGITTWPASVAPGNGVSIAEALGAIYDGVTAANSVFQEQADTAVNVNAALAEVTVFDLSVAATRYIVRSLRLKSVDPVAETVTVRLYELINDVQILVDIFAITTANAGTYHSLMDMFGLPQLAGDNLKVTVIATAAGPFAVTGQYSHALAT